MMSGRKGWESGTGRIVRFQGTGIAGTCGSAYDQEVGKDTGLIGT